MKTNYLQIVTENRHNVKKGEVFSTESKLLRALGLNGNYSGNNLISIRKAVKSWFEYERTGSGREIVVIKKYNKCRDIYTSKYRKDFPNFAVEEKYDNSIGVYAITLENQIYIGSTRVGFRTRFKQHNDKKYNKLQTKEMLEQGAVFTILQLCDGMDEVSIRRLEQQWIEEYRNNPEWTVVNDDSHVKIKGEQHRKQKQKPKYKTLKLTEEEYDLVIEYLNSIRAKDKATN